MDLNLDNLKEAAALRALDYVQPGMIVGLGTGSTAQFAIRGLAHKIERGLQVLAIPTSNRSATLARSLGIPLTTLRRHPQIDVTIDGADQVLLPSLTSIKGLGGALLREKIVALSSSLHILIIDHTKLLQPPALLGSSNVPVPVEVIPFGWDRTAQQLASLGCQPQLRLAHQSIHNSRLKTHNSKSPYRTDSKNYLLDCIFPSIPDPPALAASIKAITGVVEHGLFIDISARAVIAHPSRIEVIDRPPR